MERTSVKSAIVIDNRTEISVNVARGKYFFCADNPFVLRIDGKKLDRNICLLGNEIEASFPRFCP